MPRDGSDLCIDCGLCCNGALFSNAKAEAPEVARIESWGLTVDTFEGRLGFHLPCPRLDGTRCTIYQDRFTICRSFKCKLLNRYVAEETSLDEAQAIVAKAKQLLAEAVAEHPDAAIASSRIKLVARFADWASLTDPAERLRAGRILLRLWTAHHYFERWFYKPKDVDDPVQQKTA